jgi:hypothetical protein
MGEDLHPQEFQMLRTILTPAGSPAASVLALTGLQGAAQAHEYRHHELHYQHRAHDYRYFRWYLHEYHDRDHDRR